MSFHKIIKMCPVNYACKVHVYIWTLHYVTMYICVRASEPEGGLTCYGESCASSLVATEASCYNNGKFKFDCWMTGN